MELKKLIICSAAIAVYVFSIHASAVDVFYDFEDTDTSSWTALYNNATLTVESEDSGNHYLRLSYNGQAHRDREYYDVKAADVSLPVDDLLQVNYDIRYDEVTTAERNSDIQIKNRTGPGSSETQIVSRLSKTRDGLVVKAENGGFERIKAVNGSSFVVEPEKWYTIKMIVDTDKGLQSIYIFDRDTEELLAKKENFSVETASVSANMVTFTSKTDMCVDNVEIYNTQYTKPFINGDLYVKAGTDSQYALWQENTHNDIISLTDDSKIIWSLDKPVNDVSIDSISGMLSVGESAEPGIAVIKAEYESDSVNVTVKYAVIIEK